MNLKPETLKKMEEAVRRYPVKRSAVLPLLHLVQEDLGFIPPEAWSLGEAVVRQGGVLTTDVPYDDVVDMRFVKEAQKDLKLN